MFLFLFLFLKKKKKRKKRKKRKIRKKRISPNQIGTWEQRPGFVGISTLGGVLI